jgi:PAS domain S-box-containing protein
MQQLRIIAARDETHSEADVSAQAAADATPLLIRERRALASIVAGAPLAQVLDELLLAVEEASPGMLCSVMLLNTAGTHLFVGAAPRLPAEYTTSINGLKIGPSTGSCGTAAFLRRAVHVDDVATDPLWADYKQLALPHGLRACWSMPICGPNGRVLGTFANYFSEVRAPTQRQIEIVEFVIHTAALAIERYETDQILRESEDHYRNAVNLNPQVAWTSLPAGEIEYVGKRWQEWTGLPGTAEAWTQSVHPEDLGPMRCAWQNALDTGAPYDMEHRIRYKDGSYRWMRSRAFPRLDSQGEVIKWYGATEDIHERKLTEQALLQREAELSALNASLESQVLGRTVELTELTRHLQVAQEEERSRLARELHDEMGALFTAAKFDVARLKLRLAPLAPEIATRFSHFIDMLDRGIDLKRRIVEDLRPSALSSLGLVQALEILINEFVRSYGINVDRHLAHLDLRPDTQLTVYRLVQEALTNVATYAGATKVHVLLQQEGDSDVLVAVSDNGIGFDTSFKRISMHGLMGMHYRVQAQGGVLYIDSTLNGGTRISATLPLNRMKLPSAGRETGAIERQSIEKAGPE